MIERSVVCAICSKPFISYHGNKKTCGDLCARESLRICIRENMRARSRSERERKGLTCQICGAPVPERRRFYCSPRCGKTAARQKIKIHEHNLSPEERKLRNSRNRSPEYKARRLERRKLRQLSDPVFRAKHNRKKTESAKIHRQKARLAIAIVKELGIQL